MDLALAAIQSNLRLYSENTFYLGIEHMTLILLATFKLNRLMCDAATGYRSLYSTKCVFRSVPG